MLEESSATMRSRMRGQVVIETERAASVPGGFSVLMRPSCSLCSHSALSEV